MVKSLISILTLSISLGLQRRKHEELSTSGCGFSSTDLRSLATDAGVAWVSLGMGAEWPGERDSGPELARGWAGSWIVRICTFLATKIFQEFS